MREQLVDGKTEFGPTVTPNSPTVLRQLLNEFEDLVRDQGAPVEGHLAPGMGRETVVEQLGTIGLTPPEELVTWFEWHNGLRPTSGGKLRVDCLPPCITPSALDTAIERYYTDADADHEDGRWDAAPGWLMLDNTMNGLAVHCGGDPNSPPLIRAVDMENPL